MSSASVRLSIALQGIAGNLSDRLDAAAGEAVPFVLVMQCDGVAQYISNTDRKDVLPIPSSGPRGGSARSPPTAAPRPSPSSRSGLGRTGGMMTTEAAGQGPALGEGLGAAANDGEALTERQTELLTTALKSLNAAIEAGPGDRVAHLADALMAGCELLDIPASDMLARARGLHG